MNPNGGQLRALLAIDARSMRRDTLLRWVIFMPLLLALIMRYGLPAVNQELAARLAFDLTPYFPLVYSFLLLLAPGFLGMVFGFLLLDQRDDGSLAALRVTPIAPARLLGYRLAAPMLMSCGLTVLVFLIASPEGFPVLPLLACSVCAAFYAPLYTLILGNFARNKVEGFALVKGLGLLFLPPIAAWFVAWPWQAFFLPFPTYWPLKAWWLLEAGDGRGWLFVLGGIVVFATIIAWLTRRFETLSR